MLIAIKFIIMSLLDSLQWRYATKRMSGKKVSEEKLASILEATRLSASSYGLQPYTILVVSNNELKEKLGAAAYNQPQLIESSHVMVFCIHKTINSKDVSTYIKLIADTRSIPSEALKGFEDAILGTVSSLNDAELQNWSAKQAYLALGTAIAAAAELQVDTCPMEGFNHADFDEILGLNEKGLTSVVILPLGYRSDEDQLANAIKVRKHKDVLFEFVD